MTSLTDDHSAPAGRPRIRLEPIRHHQLVFDGCWMPHSTDLEIELPALLAALDGAGRPALRLRLSVAGWTARPTRVLAADRPVELDYCADQPRTTVTAICADGVVTLLVVPALVAEPGLQPGEQTREDNGGRLTTS
jgi:hypothetical protein